MREIPCCPTILPEASAEVFGVVEFTHPKALGKSVSMHFSPLEYTQRIAAVQSDLKALELDGIMLFAPESQYYLTGYDTFGFALYQCMILPVDGLPQLLTREPDRRQAQQTSNLSDTQIHIWADKEGCDPYTDTLTLLSELGLANKRLGIETKTPGLTAWHWQKLTEALKGGPEIIDASDVVSLRRRIKSTAEIEYTRQAAALSDDALAAGQQVTKAGAFEGDILAAMQGAVFAGGGDYAGNEFIIGSGEGALLCRYFSGRRHLDATDQLTLEWSGAYRRYHAAMMRTLVVGPISDEQKRMHAAAVEALEACERAIQPGDPMGIVFDAHARVFDQHGYAHARLNACGYGMGAVFNPIWVDHPMFYEGNPLIMNVGNVFFLHMILMDSSTGKAMCWGHSVLVTENGVERLSRSPLALNEH